jgi:prefoldin subunit 5
MSSATKVVEAPEAPVVKAKEPLDVKVLKGRVAKLEKKVEKLKGNAKRLRSRKRKLERKLGIR